MPAERRKLLYTAGAFAGGTLLSRRTPAGGSMAARQATLASADPAFACAVGLSDLQAVARRRMEHIAREHDEGAAADELTRRPTRESCHRIRANPRVPRDVGEAHTRVSVLGLARPHHPRLAELDRSVPWE